MMLLVFLSGIVVGIPLGILFLGITVLLFGRKDDEK